MFILFLNALSVIGLLGIVVSMFLLYLGHVPINRHANALAHSLELSNQQNEKLQKQLTHLRDGYEKIEASNVVLRDRLLNKNSLLKYTNEELLRHNGELMQFSFTVSHNLRSPVAALKGLLGAIKNAKKDEDKISLLGKFNDVAESLDEIVHELNDITGIRNDVYKKKEIVSLGGVINNVLSTYSEEISESNAQIELDVSSKVHLNTNKPALEGILLNIIGNGLKHRKLSRAPKVIIKGEKVTGGTLVKIKDFGIGIDLDNHSKKLFKLYSRINLEVEGRGTGLYISKLMADSIDAQITVDSELNEWTEFHLLVNDAQIEDEEILFENDGVTIDINKESNWMEMKWKENVNFGDFKEACINVNSLLTHYANEKLLIDFTKFNIPPEFIEWARINIVPVIHPSLLEISLKGAEDQMHRIEDQLEHFQNDLKKQKIRTTIQDLELLSESGDDDKVTQRGQQVSN